MRYNIRKNWITSFELILKEPIIAVPFIIIAFFEALALELIYFFPKKPLSFIANPIVAKFYGEAFTRYPGNLIILPRLFYFAHIVIYILISVFLIALSVTIIKNIKMQVAFKIDTVAKAVLRRYPSFLAYGLIISILSILVKRADMFIFVRGMPLIENFLPQTTAQSSALILTFLLFLSNVIVHTFLILVVPLIVIGNLPLLQAVAKSVSISWRNFLTIFSLIFLPFLIYFPITLLKSGAAKLMERTLPEVNLYIAVAGIMLAMFLDCFVVVCASQFLLDSDSGSILVKR